MKMRAGRTAGVSDEADTSAHGQSFADADVDPRQVRVHRDDSTVVRDLDELAEAAVPAGEHDTSGACRTDRRSLRRREVDARVKAPAARPEGARDHPLNRPAESKRALGRRRPQGGESCGPCPSVGCEPGPCLEGDERLFRPLAQHAVEVPGGKPVPGESELQSGDVPSDRAVREHAASDRVPPPPPERSARLGAWNSVDLETGAALQTPHRGRRAGPEHAVDRADVQALHRERCLERGNARAPLSPRGRRHEQHNCDRDRGLRRHGSVFAV